jgi:phosphatidylserine decarboxylase
MKIRSITGKLVLLLAMGVALLPPSLTTAGTDDEVTSKLSQASSADHCQGLLSEDLITRIASSPCRESLVYLFGEYCFNPEVPPALSAVLGGFQEPPPHYGTANPWQAASTSDELLLLMLDRFLEWCTFLPQISGDQDNGLEYIQLFSWFYYQNPAGRDFVQGRNPMDRSKELAVGLKFTEAFSHERGEFMNSPESTDCIEQWISDPRIEIEDYTRTKPGEYTSWNDFFSRNIIIDEETQTIPSRPATMPLAEYPERDYIVVSPTDCIMNPLVQVLVEDRQVTRRYLENPLDYNTVLDVKGIPISLGELLRSVPEAYRKHFVGGTGLSCVLMPNTYHHYHSPVNGKIVHAEILQDYGTYGYADFTNWVPQDGNVGRLGTDFSQFQEFERGVIIIEVTYADIDGHPLTGYVASIPVGLDTIGSVVFDEHTKAGTEVKRGYTRLGHFLYGGSLDILLFSKGLATGAVQTRLGNQIALFNIGSSEKPGEKPCK